MTKSWHLSRRTLLKGVGVAVALPFLEAMTPGLVWGAPQEKPVPPRRLGFFYVPNGLHPYEWFPKGTGRDFELSTLLKPLEQYRDQMTVLSGLTCDKARPNGDGPGDHARAMSAFLTGTQPVKTEKVSGDGPKVKAGVSVDQVAAEVVGRATRLPSLELGCEAGRQAGNCDSGYSCVYSSNLSWRSDLTPMGKEVDPRAVFDRLFSGGSKGESETARAKRMAYNKSVLDFVAEDAESLRNQLGAGDRRKLDEYLSGVRELEMRLAKVETANAEAPPDLARPRGIPKDYQEHIRLLCDLLALAFQGDLTRISTFPLANEGSNRNYKMIGVSEGHHDLSHHGGDKDKLEKILKINQFHMEQFAYFIGKLASLKEGDGCVLDNCMIMYGSGNGDGNRHNHDNLPILLMGKGGGSITPGRHLTFRRETPLTNLYLALLDRMGVQRDSFGDSNGKLEGLS